MSTWLDPDAANPSPLSFALSEGVLTEFKQIVNDSDLSDHIAAVSRNHTACLICFKTKLYFISPGHSKWCRKCVTVAATLALEGWYTNTVPKSRFYDRLLVTQILGY